LANGNMYLVCVETGSGQMGVIVGSGQAAERMSRALSSAFGREAEVVGPSRRFSLARAAREGESRSTKCGTEAVEVWKIEKRVREKLKAAREGAENSNPNFYNGTERLAALELMLDRLGRCGEYGEKSDFDVEFKNAMDELHEQELERAARRSIFL